MKNNINFILEIIWSILWSFFRSSLSLLAKQYKLQVSNHQRWNKIEHGALWQCFQIKSPLHLLTRINYIFHVPTDYPAQSSWKCRMFNLKINSDVLGPQLFHHTHFFPRIQSDDLVHSKVSKYFVKDVLLLLCHEMCTWSITVKLCKK